MSQTSIDHESASAAELAGEKQEKSQEDDPHNGETTHGDKGKTDEVEDGVDEKDEGGGDKDKDSDNEDDKPEADEDKTDKDDDDKEANEESKEKDGVEMDQVEDGEDDRPEEATVVDDGEEGKEDEKEEEITAQDGDSPEDQVETENAEEEEEGEQDLTTDGQTDLQDDGTNHQEDKPDLSEEERTRLRPIFARKAVNDRLDLKGFKILFRLLGEVVSSNDAEEMFADGDKDDDNTIDFEEFCRLYSKFRLEEHDRKQDVLASIDKLFPGNDGESVELRKVEQLLLRLQHPDLDTRLAREKSDLGEDDIRQLVRAMDADGSGLISRHEFVNALCQHIDM